MPRDAQVNEDSIYYRDSESIDYLLSSAPDFELPDSSAQVVTLQYLPLKTIQVKPNLSPRKRFILSEDGMVHAPDFNKGRWWRTVSVPVHDIQSLHEVMEGARTGVYTDGAPCCILSGVLREGVSTTSARRTKMGKPGQARTLEDAANHWLVLDADKVCNALGIDPRQSLKALQEAANYLLDLLPPSLRAAQCSWQFSSSTAVLAEDKSPLPAGVAPATLGAHLRFWLSAALNEAGRREVMKRIGLYVEDILRTRGIKIANPGRTIDPACSTLNQPIFTSAEYIGFADPLPVRSGLTHGLPEVDFASLDGELPQLGRKAAKEFKPLTEEQLAAQEARRIRQERKQADSLYRAVHRQRAEDRAEENARTVQPLPRARASKAQILRKSREYKLADIKKLTRHRSQYYEAWAYGVPVGQRRVTMLIVCGILSNMYPVAELEARTRAHAIELCGEAWTNAEFGAEKIAHILARAREAERLEAVCRNSSGVREEPWLARINNLFQVTDEEVIACDLKSLGARRARKTKARRALGVPTRQEYRAAKLEGSKLQEEPWKAAGVSRATFFRQQAAAAKAAAVEVVDVPVTVVSTTPPKPGRPLFPGVMVVPPGYEVDLETGEILLKPVARAAA